MDNKDQYDYSVVVNDEEQYSIWPIFKIVPEGWKEVGFKGKKEDCLSHISQVWTDMRPLSLRNKMDELQKEWTETVNTKSETPSHTQSEMSSTVVFLVNGIHPISTKPTDNDCKSFHTSLNRQYIHITFTDTAGGTCLGMRIDPNKTVFIDANFESELGSIEVEGICVLDYVRIKCFARINLQTLSGTASLEIIKKLTPFEAFTSI